MGRDFTRVLLRWNGDDPTMLQVIQAKNQTQGKPSATRADLRFSMGTDNQVFAEQV